MGIPGLLKEFNALVGRDAHISTYSGKRVAVDASGWLHRACYSCALELLTSPATTTAHLSLLRSFLSLLAVHNITPTLVFDGAQLPAKGNTAAARDIRRLHHRTLALEHLHSSPPNPELALFHAQKAMTVTGDVTARFIALARELSINYVVAPYEADAQMAYLTHHSLVDACITEDSDLIAFGCDRLFIRLERSGHGREIVVSDITTLTTPPPLPLPPTHTNTNTTTTTITGATTAPLPSTLAFLRRLRSVYLRGDLLGCCVLSGCDYLPSLRGVGLRTAVKWWDDYKCIELILLQMKRAKQKTNNRTTNPKKRGKQSGSGGGSGVKRKREVASSDTTIERTTAVGADDTSVVVLDAEAVEEEEEDEETVGNQGKEELYDGYALDYHKAFLTFRHQLVYDTLHGRYSHLHPLPPTLRHLSTACHTSDESNNSSDREVHTLDVGESSIADTSQSLSSRMSLSTRHDAQLASLDFLGAPPPQHLMSGLVSGLIDPRTLRPYEERKLTDFFSAASERKEAAVTAAAASDAREAAMSSEMRIERSKRLVAVDREFFAELLDADVDISSANTAAAHPAQRRDSSGSSISGGGGKSSAAKRPMGRGALEKERKLKEERRSTGGGLLRFFKSAAVTAVVCSSASAAPT